MQKTYYENHLKEQVVLTNWPYMVLGGDIFDGDWSEIENDDHIQGWERGIQKKKIMIDVRDTGQAFINAINRLEDVLERDIIANTAGRLYVGSQYLRCWISGSVKDRWVNDLPNIGNELTVKSDYPFWISEATFTFFPSEDEDTGNKLGIDYEYDYEYEYAGDNTLQYLVNDHYTDSGFRLTIYGPCITPAIRIGGHLYEIETTLYDGEYAVVDSSSKNSQDRAVYKVTQDGDTEDLFNSRNKDSDIFMKIPTGRNTVTWNGTFGFDVTLYNERGAPKWTL